MIQLYRFFSASMMKPSSSSTAPRWKTAITNALQKFPRSVVVQLATIDDTTPVPQVRSHIFRKFLQIERHLFLVSSTDIRTPKVAQMTANPHIQILWYIEGTGEQFRIAGQASFVPSPERNDKLKHPHVDFDWESERMGIFKSLSAHMRASWCRPVPGTPLKGGEEEMRSWPRRVDEPGHEQNEDGSEVSEKDKRRNKVNWDTAVSRFTLVVIDPVEVDSLDMGVVPNRRYRFSKIADGIWTEQEVVA